MSQMTMNRVIHAAVRRDLSRTERALRAFPDGDSSRAGELDQAWRNLVAELTHHHEQEDQLIWPALRDLGVDPALLETMESEHQDMAAALARAGAAMTALRGSASARDAGQAADAVQEAGVVTERHLTHEENELEPALVPHLESPEWKAVEKQLRAGSPVRAGRMFAWLLDGSPHAEEEYLRSTIPGPVLFVLSRVLGRGYGTSIAPVWRR